MDKTRIPPLLFLMDQPTENQPPQKFTTPVSLLVDLVLVVLFSIYMFTVLRTHVPSNDPKMILIWGLISTSCMTAVFWLTLQMFRVVYRAHRDSRK